MKVIKRSNITGKDNEMELPVSLEKMIAWESSGALIQNFFPELNDDQREFLLTGMTPEEWDEHIGSEDDDEADAESDEPAF